MQAIVKLAVMVHICQGCGIAGCMSSRLASTSSESLSQKTKAKMSCTDIRGWISTEEMCPLAHSCTGSLVAWPIAHHGKNQWWTKV